MSELKLDYDNVDDFCQSLGDFETNFGQFTRFGAKVSARWLFVKSRDYGIEALSNFIVKYPICNNAIHTMSLIREGISIMRECKVTRYATLIICRDDIESYQWYLQFQRLHAPSVLLIRGKRKHLPECDVYIVSRAFYHMFKGETYHRIIFYNGFEDKTFAFESSLYCYTITDVRYVYQWQKFQTVSLSIFSNNKPQVIHFQTYEKHPFYFKHWDFPKENAKNDHFQCPVCLDQFDYILRLECNHNVCAVCLKTNYLVGNQMHCPMCRGNLFGSTNIKCISRNAIEDFSLESCLHKASLIIRNSRYIMFDTQSKINKKNFISFQQNVLTILRLNIEDDFPMSDFSDINYIVCDYTVCHTPKLSMIHSIFNAFCKINRSLPLNIILICSHANTVNVWKQAIEHYFA